MCNTFVEELLALGVEQGSSQLCPTKYRVVRADNSYCCEIQVGFSLNLKVHIHSSFVSSFFFSRYVICSSHRHAVFENKYCSISGHAGGRGTKRMGVWRVEAERNLDLFERVLVFVVPKNL